MGGEPAQKMTYQQYDMKLWKTAFFGQVMQCVVVGGIHYKWGSVMPLVMSVIMALINASSNPLVRLHIFSEDPSGLSPEKAAEITRPFAQPKSAFSSMMQAEPSCCRYRCLIFEYRFGQEETGQEERLIKLVWALIFVGGGILMVRKQKQTFIS